MNRPFSEAVEDNSHNLRRKLWGGFRDSRRRFFLLGMATRRPDPRLPEPTSLPTSKAEPLPPGNEATRSRRNLKKRQPHSRRCEFTTENRKATALPYGRMVSSGVSVETPKTFTKLLQMHDNPAQIIAGCHRQPGSLQAVQAMKAVIQGRQYFYVPPFGITIA